MRPLNLAVPVLLLLVLSACASTAGSGTYVDELRELSDSCEARGGILVPNGQQSGRPQTDNVCRITGGASRLTSGG
ncbi:MAG: hypothetical protein ACOVQF_05710 [Brevundimonas sp.]|jgi:hypothetical protein